jgi:hypothetical protein
MASRRLLRISRPAVAVTVVVARHDGILRPETKVPKSQLEIHLAESLGLASH